MTLRRDVTTCENEIDMSSRKRDMNGGFVRDGRRGGGGDGTGGAAGKRGCVGYSTASAFFRVFRDEHTKLILSRLFESSSSLLVDIIRIALFSFERSCVPETFFFVLRLHHALIFGILTDQCSPYSDPSSIDF